MVKQANFKQSVVVHAELTLDGTLRLRICEDQRTMRMSDPTIVRPDPVGAVSDVSVGRAFLQLCSVPLMARKPAAV